MSTQTASEGSLDISAVSPSTAPAVTSTIHATERTVATAAASVFASKSDEWTATQAAVFAAIVDTIATPVEITASLPSVVSVAASKAFASTPASFYGGYGQALGYLNAVVRPSERTAIRAFLSLLGTSHVSYAFTGFATPFQNLGAEDRVVALQTLWSSRLAPVRVLTTAMYGIAVVCLYGVPGNPLWKAIGYESDPGTERPRPAPESVWRPTFVTIPSPVSANEMKLSCDVVIVGSGAGGGVMAGELAQAGYSVIVLEKALYVHQSDLPFTEKESFERLYENQAGLMTDDGSVRILAGSAFGGGTAVNWSASLQLPFATRQEWARKGLPYFASQEYSNAIDSVAARVGVSTSGIKHNSANSILMEGSKRLGMPHGPIPQNTAGQAHECGYCMYGCPYGEKQSTHVTYLKDAAETGNARFVEGVKVDRILKRRGRAVGVIGTVRRRKEDGGGEVTLRVDARRVVVSAGAIHTPALLLRSGFKNKHIGRSLRLHPAIFVFGVFPNRQKQIKPWSGSIMTVLNTAVENVHGDGYGAKLEIPALHPALFSSLAPWRSPSEHKRIMLNMPDTVPVLVLVRDSCDNAGRVTIPNAKQAFDEPPNIAYAISPKDQQSLYAGVEAAIRVLVAAGATEIYTCQPGVPSYFPDLADPNVMTSQPLTDYLKAVAAWGYKPNWQPIGSAHQMGTCRLGKSPADGACAPSGEAFDLKGCYVADASLFPTASGVNPMLTTLSLAYMTAQSVKADLALAHEEAKL
ncbi:hypothetical protein HDU86_004764 [Geranomyces michiganensis]|nr:hypothetical protein HDU86_004764 [Geranomyces michiganensis]